MTLVIIGQVVVTSAGQLQAWIDPSIHKIFPYAKKGGKVASDSAEYGRLL